MIRRLAYAIVLPLTAAAAVFGVGALLPRRHSAAMAGVVARPAAEVAATIRAVRDPGVAVENVVESSDAVSYVEVAGGERIAYRQTEPVRGARFIATIVDDALPFGGTWTLTLTATADGGRTQVRIQEDGDIRDPLYRCFARFVFGYTGTMRAYLDALGGTGVETVPAS